MSEPKKSLLVTYGLIAVVVSVFFIVGPKDVFEMLGGPDYLLSLYAQSPPGVLLLLVFGVAAFVFAASDLWWPILRRKIGIPDPVPQLEFLWPDDPGERLYHSREDWDVVVTVRNPSHTETLTSVRVVLEWWMRAQNHAGGAYPQQNDRLLQMQFEPKFECALGPRDLAKFRLCRMVGGDETHSLVIAARDSGDHYNAGAGTFVFNVRASADNALSRWDFYRIEATEYGTYTTERDTAAARIPPP